MDEEMFCKYLLSLKKRRYSMLRYYKKRLVAISPILLLIAAAVCALVKDLGFDSACILTLGLCFGMLFRDFFWIRNIKKSWPLRKRITDWKLVDRIAGGQASHK